MFLRITLYIGIDRGINKLAVTSDNRFFLGGKTKKVCKII
jgi:hypothetical protein